MTAYYRGFSIGAMGVVGPIAATAVVIPLAVGLIMGDDPSGLQAGGIVLAVAGIIATGYQPGGGRGGHLALGVGMAILAAIGIGIYYPLVDFAAEDTTIVWVVFLHRIGAVTTIVLFVYPYLARGPMKQSEHSRDHFGLIDTGSLIGVGVISVTSTALFAAATTEGLLSVVSVLAAMFPVTTILACPALPRRAPRHPAARGRGGCARRRGSDRRLDDGFHGLACARAPGTEPAV